MHVHVPPWSLNGSTLNSSRLSGSGSTAASFGVSPSSAVGLVGQGPWKTVLCPPQSSPWSTSGRPTAWKFLLLRMGLRLSLGGP